MMPSVLLLSLPLSLLITTTSNHDLVLLSDEPCSLRICVERPSTVAPVNCRVFLWFYPPCSMFIFYSFLSLQTRLQWLLSGRTSVDRRDVMTSRRRSQQRFVSLDRPIIAQCLLRSRKHSSLAAASLRHRNSVQCLRHRSVSCSLRRCKDRYVK